MFKLKSQLLQVGLIQLNILKQIISLNNSKNMFDSESFKSVIFTKSQAEIRKGCEENAETRTKIRYSIFTERKGALILSNIRSVPLLALTLN